MASRKTPRLSRRHFVTSLFVGGAAATAGSTALRSSPAPSGAPATAAAAPVSSDWVEVARAQIPALQRSLYFQSGAYGPSPHRVMNAMKAALDLQNEAPADPKIIAQITDLENLCRTRIAQLTGADPTEVALTSNTTTGLNVVLWSIDWKAGDEIIIGDEEHPAMLLPVYNLERRFGVRRRVVPVGDPSRVVAEVLDRLTPTTRLVALSHVSRGSGRTVPGRELATALRARNVRLLLDGAQGPGNVRVNFREIGCDYYSLCGHKWLLGPKGTGALLVRPDALEATPISWTGSRAQATFDEVGNVTWLPDARRYEFATRNSAGFAGLAEALGWLDELGWDRIHARIIELAGFATQSVQASQHLAMTSPIAAEARNGIVVVRLPAACKATAAYQTLSQEDRMLLSPVTHPQDIRISVHFFNLPQEIAAVIDRLDRYAAAAVAKA